MTGTTTPAPEQPGMDQAEAKRFAEEEIIPAAQKLAENFLNAAFSDAHAEGWDTETAQRIGAAGTAAFVRDVFAGTPPEEAFAEAFKAARAEVVGHRFQRAVEGTGNRAAAFRTVLAMLRHSDARSGGTGTSPPPRWVDAATEAFEAAAATGKTEADQIAAGLRTLRNLAREAEVDAGLGYS